MDDLMKRTDEICDRIEEKFDKIHASLDWISDEVDKQNRLLKYATIPCLALLLVLNLQDVLL